MNELLSFSQHAVRDNQCAKIYHPDDGRVYGGMQEGGGEMLEWRSCSWQTWSATALSAMILYGICGIDPSGKNKPEPLYDPRIGHGSLQLHYPVNGNTVKIDFDFLKGEIYEHLRFFR